MTDEETDCDAIRLFPPQLVVRSVMLVSCTRRSKVSRFVNHLMRSALAPVKSTIRVMY